MSCLKPRLVALPDGTVRVFPAASQRIAAEGLVAMKDQVALKNHRICEIATRGFYTIQRSGQ